MATARCDHCLLTFPVRDAVHDKIDGERKVFCCNGCRGISLLIHSEGLDEFYDRRTGWSPGPPESVEVRVEPFLDSIAAVDGRREIDINIAGIRCASCVWLIEHALKKCRGVADVTVNYATHKARVRWLPETIGIESILRKITALGYTPRPYTPTLLEEQLRAEKRDLLVRFGTASFLSMQLMLFTTALYAGYFQGIEPFYKRAFEIVAWAISTPVMFYCGYPFMKNTGRGMKSRTLNMDTLIFLGSFSAYGYSVAAIFVGGDVYFDTSAMIITLILLGRFLEAGAKARATGAISSLVTLQPKEARLVRRDRTGEELLTVPVASLQVGDIVEVIPGEKIPVDCSVLDGASEVDESLLTGESVAVSKKEGAEVFGGTLNLNGRLVLEVRRVGGDTVVSQVVRAVEDAQARRAPIQKVADRVVGWFVPAIISIAAATFLFWFLKEGLLASSLMTAIAVLVIACPCALGLATPLAVLIGSTMLSSQGVLLKGGDTLETIAGADAVCFDKTGTVTLGKPSLVSIVRYGISRDELHRLAASIERYSEHAIAGAIRRGIDPSSLYPIESFKAYPGQAVEGFRNGERLAAGNLPFLRSSGVPIGDEQMNDFSLLTSRGSTVIGLAAGQELKGWFEISDDLRKEVPEVVRDLKSGGYAVSLLSGDHRSVAEEIGKRAGISVIDAEILPVQKAERIRQFREAGRRVVMVGDGINDAPALIEADAGVAVGGATGIAMESADVVLMRGDLRLVPELLRISRKTLTVVKQNLFWAFSYNLIAIPLAVSGTIHPIISAGLMAISSLVVVGNSLRLRRAR